MIFRQPTNQLVEAVQALIADSSTVDVRVRCKDHQPSDGLGAHRLILAAASPDFLKDLLLNANLEDELICLHLPDYQSWEMGPIMSLIYYGEVWINEAFALDCQKILQDLKIAVELEAEQEQKKVKVKSELPLEVKVEKHHIKLEPSESDNENLNESVLTTPESEVNDVPAKASVSCSECTYKTSSLSSLQAHRVVHARRTSRLLQNKTCPACQQVLESPKAARDHAIQFHSEMIDDEIHCIMDENCTWSCDLGTDTCSHDFLQHLKEKHKCIEQDSFNVSDDKEEPLLKCDFPHCGYETRKGFNLTQHFRSHNNEKRHACPICNKQFLASSHLRNHIKSLHTKERNFQCPKCPRAFVTAWQVKCHVKSNHDTKTYSCKKCSKIFKTPQSYAGHVKSAHQQKTLPKDKFHRICEICGQSLVQGHQCDQITEKDKKVTCHICQKTMESKSLRAHIQYHRKMEVTKNVCQFCNRSFTTETSLKRHILIHQNLKPFTCSVCEKGFRQKSTLEAHLKTHNRKQ